MVPNIVSDKFTLSDVALGIELVIGHKMTLLETSDIIGCSQSTLRNWLKKHYFNKPEKVRKVKLIVLQSKINKEKI